MNPIRKPAPTVLITGSSSGIGRATALLFSRKGWKVSATLRSPSPETELDSNPRVIRPELDVTRPETIRAAVHQTLDQFGSLDAIVNNAGYALSGPFELSTPEQILRQHETNLFGPMRLIQECLPHFRAQGRGVIVNVSSLAGRTTFPFHSLYHSSKWALEGFSESLAYELRELGILVKLVEPGAVRTDFYHRSADRALATSIPEYEALVQRAAPTLSSAGDLGARPERVAATIYRAVTDPSRRLRYVSGADAQALLIVRGLLPFRVFRRLVRATVFRR